MLCYILVFAIQLIKMDVKEEEVEEVLLTLGVVLVMVAVDVVQIEMT